MEALELVQPKDLTASEIAVRLGATWLPTEIVEQFMTDDEATIVMVDSNLQREQILPSEKAFAYKMELDAMKRQGQRTDLTCEPLAHKLSGKKSRDILAEQVGESKDQIRRYIRLTHLIPEILDLVDNSVLKEKDILQIALRPAVELSYLSEEEQQDLVEIMESEDCTPSHAQAIKMRQFSQEGRLDANVLLSIMQEEKPNQVEQFKMPKERIRTCFFAHLQLHTAFHHMSALSLRVGTMYYIHANWCR